MYILRSPRLKRAGVPVRLPHTHQVKGKDEVKSLREEAEEGKGRGQNEAVKLAEKEPRPSQKRTTQPGILGGALLTTARGTRGENSQDDPWLPASRQSERSEAGTDLPRRIKRRKGLPAVAADRHIKRREIWSRVEASQSAQRSPAKPTRAIDRYWDGSCEGSCDSGPIPQGVRARPNAKPVCPPAPKPRRTTCERMDWLALTILRSGTRQQPTIMNQ